MAAATGTASLSIPIAVSPGRAGMQPALSLSYSSGAGNGTYGLGWSLDLPAISRRTDKKLPEYADGRDSDVFILSGAEDLVRTLVESESAWRPEVMTRDGLLIERFRPRTEGLFARIERRTELTSGDVFWVTIDRSNVTSVYGRSANARIADPANSARVYSWLLEATYDDRGNVVVYDYKAEDFSNVSSAVNEPPRRDGPGVGAQKYIKRIRYGNVTPVRGQDLSLSVLTTNTWCFSLVFDYGEHDKETPTPLQSATWACRQDPFSSYKPCFELRTYRLCQRVLMFHQFDRLGEEPVLVRSTDFAYDEGPSVTYLRSVTHKGYTLENDGYTSASMPPVELDYRLPALQSTVKSLDKESGHTLPSMIDGRTHRWVDLDGEGVCGLLSDEAGALRYRRNLGGGKLAPAKLLARQPSNTSLAGGRQELMSLEGDGRLDLVELDGPLAGYFERKAGDQWGNFVPFAALPGLDWNDPNLQLIDLNGDGFADILITQGNALVWYPSLGKRGFAPPLRVPLPRDEADGPTIISSDSEQSIHLADMSGDGSSDLVRIRNSQISYWPNLGFGKFGAQIIMANAPRVDRLDQFDPARVRLFDVDGSGTTDVLYCGADAVTLWSNQAGNGFSAGQVVTTALSLHSAASITVVDLLGTGTGCLVWNTSLVGDGPARLRFIDLLDSKKPHLLIAQRNGMGLERFLSYAPSTKFYLEDCLAGVTWATRLPFPVQVVERVETRDYLAGTKLVSRYRYRHGFYDGHEREFRGFGLVEQWDTESFDDHVGSGTFPPDLFPDVEDEFVLPAVHTKTWFHTGAWLEAETLEAAFRAEYYSGDPNTAFLPDTAFSSISMSDLHELREASRALKGMTLRQEVYADDDTLLASHPYAVTESGHEVRRIQPRTAGAPHAVFYPHLREALTYAYERVGDDPRVQHAMTLAVDDFGVVTSAATIAYRRRATGAVDSQNSTLVSVSEANVTHVADQGWYRIGVPLAQTSYQLTGLAEPDVGTVYSLGDIKTAFETATELAYEFDPTPLAVERRAVSKSRIVYYEDDLSAALPFGIIDSLALPHHEERLALTAGLIRTVYSSDIDDTILTDEGGYLQLDDDYWAPTPRPLYDADHFFLPIGAIEPFGNQSSVTYDDYSLLVVQAESSITTPALNNVVRVENDYRVLQPRILTDQNLNRTALAFDPLGMVVKTALMGKSGAGEGDSLEDPTTLFAYDLFAFKTASKPTVSHIQARVEHGGTAVWQQSYVYTDGSGRTLLTKTQAAPDGAAARWIGSGRTVFDNKGNPIKKYEPYFSGTSEFENEASVVGTGVTPILHYDPLGRLIRTDFPDGTYAKIVFDAWRQESWDQNDTVADSLWYEQRRGLATGDPNYRAGTLAYAHRDTPTVTHFDTLGRPVAVTQDAGGSLFYTTTTTLDVLGNALAVTDARGNIPQAQVFDVLRRPIQTTSAEAGVSYVLADVNGTAIRSKNSREWRMRTTFDAVRRPTRVYAKHDSDDETLVLRTIHGESLGSSASADANLRGQAYRMYDSAGVQTDSARDFKGNLLSTQRTLAIDYTATPDWSDLATLTDVGDMEAAAASLLEVETFTTSSAFDALNRIVNSTTPDASVTTPKYDEANLLEAMASNVRGAGSPTSFVDAITYNARGQRLVVTYSNGVVSVHTYDAETFRLTRLLSIRTSDEAVLQDIRYYYDAVGNIVATKDYADQELYLSGTSSAFASPDSKYEYDPLYRLVRAEGREHPSIGGTQVSNADLHWATLPHPNDTQALRRYTEEYEYDGVGNILSLAHRAHGSSPPSWTRLYQYAESNNRLTGTSNSGDTPDAAYANTTSYSDAYTHDTRGNMNSMPHLAAMDWDYGDRLQHCDLGGGGDSYFVYDAGGTRVRKVWVKPGALIEERTYVGAYEFWRKTVSNVLDQTRETLHVPGGSGDIALVETLTVDSGSDVAAPVPRTRYQLPDHLDSSRVELANDGSLITYEEYHPFGSTAFRACATSAGVSAKRYRYSGKERDEETGLQYFIARYLLPWLARWLSPDPKGLIDGTNRYAAVRNNPIGNRDPDGTQVAGPALSAEQVQAKNDAATKEYKEELKSWDAERRNILARAESEVAAAPNDETRLHMIEKWNEARKDWLRFKPSAPVAIPMPKTSSEGSNSSRIILGAVAAGLILVGIGLRVRSGNVGNMAAVAEEAKTIAADIVDSPAVPEAIDDVAATTNATAPTIAAEETTVANQVASAAETGKNVADRFAATEASVLDKLNRYLLAPEHEAGGPKAKWFELALGFTRANADELAAQIQFDAEIATKTGLTQYGQKYNQVIPILGANSRMIDVTFGWIYNLDKVLRLTTAIPAKK